MRILGIYCTHYIHIGYIEIISSFSLSFRMCDSPHNCAKDVLQKIWVNLQSQSHEIFFSHIISSTKIWSHKLQQNETKDIQEPTFIIIARYHYINEARQNVLSIFLWPLSSQQWFNEEVLPVLFYYPENLLLLLFFLPKVLCYARRAWVRRLSIPLCFTFFYIITSCLFLVPGLNQDCIDCNMWWRSQCIQNSIGNIIGIK